MMIDNSDFVFPEKYKPHGYQKRAAKFLLEKACGALLLEPGLGKTATTLSAIKTLKTKGLLQKVLIIAPLRVCYTVWPREILKWEDFNGLKAVILHGKNKDAAVLEEADIYLINPEGLPWLMKAAQVAARNGKKKLTINTKWWQYLGFDLLVVDELSKFKHTNTNRFSLLKQVIKTFSRRWGLTGSPAANGLLDLFGQFYVLDEGNALGKYITQYRLKYFISDYMGYNWTLQPGADKLIYERIRPLSLQMSATDYLEMPEIIENFIHVDLPADVRKFYKELEDKYVACYQGDRVVANTAAVVCGKLRQVACGGLYLHPDLVFNNFKPLERKREWLNLHNEKTQALEDLIDELQGEQLLVAYEYEHDLDRLRARFKHAVFAADYPMTRFPEMEKAWNEGRIPLLFGHPQSIGHGLNLQQRGFHLCWHSITWNYELYTQFNDRLYRQGNKSKKVFVHHLVARDTIDNTILSMLKRKEMTQNLLFSALKEDIIKKH